MKKTKVTMKDVAKHANVSKATVSYVLNGVDKVSDETRNRVLLAIDELGYIPSETARDLAKNVSNNNEVSAFVEEYPFYQEFMDSFLKNKVGKISKENKNKMLSTIGQWGYLPTSFLGQLIKQSKTIIAVFLPIDRDYRQLMTDRNPFYRELLSCLEHTAQQNNLMIRVYNSNDSDLLTENFLDQSILGGIIVGKQPKELTNILYESKLPVVVIDDSENNMPFTNITSDDKKGAFDSIEYLILKGHKRIAFVGCESEIGIYAERRLEGYIEALKTYGILFKMEDVFLSEVESSYEEGIRMANRIFATGVKYDAIYCLADIMAIGLMKGLMKLGVNVPNDISIMGFDNIQFSKYCNPELTTVNQNIYLKAETAVLVILRKSQGEPVKKEYVLPVSIVERESVVAKV